MKQIFFILSLILTISSSSAQEFSTYFTDNTMRLDYNLIGNAKQQTIALNEIVAIEGWAGRRVNLDQVPVRGNGEIKVLDSQSGTTIYRNTFSTLFQEWVITDEAEQLTKSFEATMLVPYPHKSVDIEISLFDNKGIITATLKHTVDPNDKLIRRIDSSNTIAPKHQYLHQGGNDEECIDVVILSEGYTEQEMDIFLSDARTACDEILSYAPFNALKERFNFIAVMLPSRDSGVSIPQDGIWKETALNSNFMTFYSPRYLTTNSIHQMHNLIAGIPCEHIIILANTTTYGGGGIYNSYTLTTAHHPMFKPVVVHEFGHSFAGLGDEYFYEQTDHTEGTYDLSHEPWEQNITSLVDFRSKWEDMLPVGYTIPTEPTDERKASYEVGVYEGGGYITKGMYRPAVICRMRDNEATQFCPVCQRAIERIIRFHVEQQE